MPNTCQAKKRPKEKNISGWDHAIADAKMRIKKLEFSIHIFRPKKKAGETWPGESATQN
jgi:hypothetical protein